MAVRSVRDAGAPHFGAGEVDLAVAEAVHRLVVGRGAAEQRADARAQLARAERLGHVVVGAHVEAHHLFGLLRLGGQHQHRRPDLGAPQVAADLEAVLAAAA